MSTTSAKSHGTTSFTTKRVNATTFVVREDDAYEEHPFIYVKLHPHAPVLVLSDTGCDEPSDKHKHDRYTHLRHYLEHYPLPLLNNQPLNPGGKRQYIIICTHCHYDHIGGIMQFLRGGTTEIIASAAGRDFIESDLAEHAVFNYIGRPTPYYHVTKWAQAFERLQVPFAAAQQQRQLGTRGPSTTDLGITMLQTVGHTPDELAWYDHAEMHLYVGDSFYREGADGMPIIFPREGNMIEWIFSMQKLAVFVRTENAKAAKAMPALERLSIENTEAGEEDEWVQVQAPRRVLISCAHQTTGVDGAEILAELEAFSFRVIGGKVPVVRTSEWRGEKYDLWREEGKERTPMSIKAPRRLMEDVRAFFGH